MSSHVDLCVKEDNFNFSQTTLAVGGGCHQVREYKVRGDRDPGSRGPSDNTEPLYLGILDNNRVELTWMT